MIQKLKVMFALVFAFFLMACAGPVPKIDITPAALSKIQSVAVVRPPEVKTFTVMNFGHPGMAFGLVGGLIAAGDQSSKQDQLTKVLKEHDIRVTSALAENVAAQLTRQGFQATVEDAAWEESEGRFKLPFDNIKSDADVVVIVAPTIIGFIATGVTSDYIPTLSAVVTVLGKDRKAPLYRGFHVSGWQPKADGWRHTPAATTFSNFESLMANPSATSRSLNQAASAVAVTIADDLRR